MKKNAIMGLIMSIFTLSSFSAEIDLKNSDFTWKGKKLAGAHTGKIKIKESKLSAEKELLKGGEIVMDMNSLTVEDLKGEWATQFLTHIKSKDFFTTEKFPTAKLVIKKIEAKEMVADLTIKDKTQELRFPYSQKGKEYKGTLIFDRTKFDMIYGSGDFFKNLGDKMIDNKVELDFKVVLK